MDVRFVIRTLENPQFPVYSSQIALFSKYVHLHVKKRTTVTRIKKWMSDSWSGPSKTHKSQFTALKLHVFSKYSTQKICMSKNKTYPTVTRDQEKINVDYRSIKWSDQKINALGLPRTFWHQDRPNRFRNERFYRITNRQTDRQTNKQTLF